MENKPKRRSRKPKTEVTEPTINHSELIDKKVSQIISLQNGLNANERLLEDLNIKIKDYAKQVSDLKYENSQLRMSYTNLKFDAEHVVAQLNKIPSFFKWLFNIR
jgi:chromosome segregation ATPase